jgi:hypothetical protein
VVHWHAVSLSRAVDERQTARRVSPEPLAHVNPNPAEFQNFLKTKTPRHGLAVTGWKGCVGRWSWFAWPSGIPEASGDWVRALRLSFRSSTPSTLLHSSVVTKPSRGDSNPNLPDRLGALVLMLPRVCGTLTGSCALQQLHLRLEANQLPLRHRIF